VENLEKLIVDLKESLERELHVVQEGIAHLNSRFDTQAARLERHAGLWQTGARWSSRMDAWAEKVDGSLEAKDHEIAELRERLQRLERRST
jgi:chromosome segregation ATPase